MSQINVEIELVEPTKKELAEAARIEARRCRKLNDIVGAEWFEFEAWTLENMQDMELSQ